MVHSVYYKKSQKTTIRYVSRKFPNFSFYLLYLLGENPNLKTVQS
ncbi:hypothetical protein STRDD04_01585 [Streptococcus sp. DD04]|nr:hypothetical protein STRDD04_01585 [Streptococcus sp. DD04]